jgi:medium-chain acyl-[acyl-carrier-protein] hydrolase
MPDPAWLPFNRAGVDRSSRVKLLCFPYAGGGASAYAAWLRRSPAHLQVLPVQLPGREHRVLEAPFTRMATLVDALTDTLVDRLDGPLALFGHSLGALVATELAKRMSREGRPPVHLFVSGFPPPHYPRTVTRLHQLGRDDMLRELCRLNGLRAEVLASPDLLDLIVPLLYADLRVEETHPPTGLAVLPCPISVFAADEDPVTSRESIAAWEEATSSRCVIRRFPGDHFYLLARLDELMELIECDLADSLANC